MWVCLAWFWLADCAAAAATASSLAPGLIARVQRSAGWGGSQPGWTPALHFSVCVCLCALISGTHTINIFFFVISGRWHFSKGIIMIMICVYIYILHFILAGFVVQFSSTFWWIKVSAQNHQLEWEETRLLGGADECQAVERNHFLRLVCVCLFFSI